ncbi:MAG: zinc ribbon domain-containing protein [Anaerolineae bacterium]
MPIYEYLCPECNRVYNFLVQRPDPDRHPACPKCGAEDLRKQVSRFAFKRSGEAASKGDGDGGFPVGEGSGDDGGWGEGGPGGGEGPEGLDDPRTDREMMRLMRDMEHLDENDPKQLAQMMRRMSTVTGEPFDAEMEDAVRRLESGEDPERVEEDMGGGLLGGPDGGGMSGPPSYDDDLYSF